MFGAIFRPPEVSIEFEGADSRAHKEVTLEPKGGTEKLPIFGGHESVAGTVTIQLKPGSKIEHIGIKVELIGQIEFFHDDHPFEFISLVRELEAPGVLNRSNTYPFDFSSADKPEESYNGLYARLRYFVRVTISRQMVMNIGNVKHERDLWVVNAMPPPEENNSVKLEVGIEDCLHLEFEFTKVKYHLQDIVLGKIYFLLVRIKIKKMELAILRCEAGGTGSNRYSENETVCRYELMDGAPVKAECIPIRMFLGHYDMTPTYADVRGKFSVRYYFNIVLIDEGDRRFFKKQEIIFWRKDVTTPETTLGKVAW
eukprot:g6033.t1